MAKLKLGPIADEKPVRITVDLPAAVHRELIGYAEILGGETGQTLEPTRLVAPMLARFMATDRGFSRLRRGAPTPVAHSTDSRPSKSRESDSG